MLALSGVAILLIAIVDYWTKAYLEIGILYLLPVAMSAPFLPRSGIVLLAVLAAVLSEQFSGLNAEGKLVRLVLVSTTVTSTGLFVRELARIRQLTATNEQRIRALVETTPTAIVTVGEDGVVELANQAAVNLFAPLQEEMVGQPIAAFLPQLHHAVRREAGPQFRASMQCLAHRGDGEPFPVEVWFSTYREGESAKLAAIIADMSGEQIGGREGLEPAGERKALSDRELQVLRLVLQGFSNKEIAHRLEITESTVKNTLQQLFAKTDVRTRSQLVRVALEQYRDLM